MEKKNSNEELQNRREFFKKAAKAALPVVGAVVLSSLPIVKSEAATSCFDMTCRQSCSGSCITGCYSSCQNECKNGCLNSCYNTCSGGCARQAYA